MRRVDVELVHRARARSTGSTTRRARRRRRVSSRAGTSAVELDVQRRAARSRGSRARSRSRRSSNVSSCVDDDGPPVDREASWCSGRGSGSRVVVSRPRPESDELVPVRGDRGPVVASTRRGARRWCTRPGRRDHERRPAPRARCRPAPRTCRVVQRGQVVAAGRADERDHEPPARGRVRPHAGGAVGSKRTSRVDAAVGRRPVRRAGDRRRRARSAAAGPRELAEHVERELQPAGRAAVLVLVAVPVRVDTPSGVEPARGGAERVDRRAGARPPARSSRRSARSASAASSTVSAVASTPVDRPQGIAVPSGPDHGVDQVERGAQRRRPTAGRAAARAARRTARRRRCRCRSGRTRWLRVVEVVPRGSRRGARAARSTSASSVRGRRRARARARRSSHARQHRGVVAGEHAGVEQLDPVAAVGGAARPASRCVVGRSRRAAGCRRTRRGAAASRRSGTRRTCGCGRRRPAASCAAMTRVDRARRRARDAGVGEVREREAEVGAHVGVDRVAGERRAGSASRGGGAARAPRRCRP